MMLLFIYGANTTPILQGIILNRLMYKIMQKPNHSKLFTYYCLYVSYHRNNYVFKGLWLMLHG